MVFTQEGVLSLQHLDFVSNFLKSFLNLITELLDFLDYVGTDFAIVYAQIQPNLYGN